MLEVEGTNIDMEIGQLLDSNSYRKYIKELKDSES